MASPPHPDPPAIPLDDPWDDPLHVQPAWEGAEGQQTWGGEEATEEEEEEEMTGVNPPAMASSLEAFFTSLLTCLVAGAVPDLELASLRTGNTAAGGADGAPTRLGRATRRGSVVRAREADVCHTKKGRGMRQRERRLTFCFFSIKKKKKKGRAPSSLPNTKFLKYRACINGGDFERVYVHARVCARARVCLGVVCLRFMRRRRASGAHLGRIARRAHCAPCSLSPAPLHPTAL